MTEQSKSLDILGIKPVGDAALLVTKATTDGAGAFLSRICLPAAEEIGFLLQDKVRAWRAEQAIKITARAQEKYRAAFGEADLHAPPRLIGSILEHGSWEDDDQVQGMWAGLMASSCTEKGKSQDNLIFINILGNMTASEAKLVAFTCENVRKLRTPAGLLIADDRQFTTEELMAGSEIADILVLDIAIDHLCQLGLLAMGSTLSIDGQSHRLSPSSISLHFYARCMGHATSVFDYYEVEDAPPNFPFS
jgi:hypothetical protein